MKRESLFYFTSTMRKGVVIVLCAHIQCVSQYPSAETGKRPPESVTEEVVEVVVVESRCVLVGSVVVVARGVQLIEFDSVVALCAAPYIHIQPRGGTVRARGGS